LLCGRIGHIEPGVKVEVQDFPMHPECQIESKITLVKRPRSYPGYRNIHPDRELVRAFCHEFC
jgi:hypothetical protein